MGDVINKGQGQCVEHGVQAQLGGKGASWSLFPRTKSESDTQSSSRRVPAPLRTSLPRACGGEGCALPLSFRMAGKGKGGEGRGEKCVVERDWESHPTQLTALPVKTWQAVGGTSPLEAAWTEGLRKAGTTVKFLWLLPGEDLFCLKCWKSHWLFSTGP